MTKAKATYTYNKALRLSRLGKTLMFPDTWLGNNGNTNANNNMINKAPTPITPNVVRQPQYCPNTVPMGTPNTVASDEPVMIKLKALACLPLGASLTAMGMVIDQNTACAAAMPKRATNKLVKLHAIAANTWLETNNTNKHNSNLRRSNRAVSMVNGKDKIVTAHAYTVMINPVWETDMSKLLAILGNKPTGTNSVVLKIKAATAKAVTANQECSGRFCERENKVMCVEFASCMLKWQTRYFERNKP